VLQSMGSQRVGHDWATELNNNLVKKVIVCIERRATLKFTCIYVIYISKRYMRTYAPQHVKNIHSSIINNIPKVKITEKHQEWHA